MNTKIFAWRDVINRHAGYATEYIVRCCYPRANGAKRRSGRKPGARVTNSALTEFKVVAYGS